LSRLAAPASRDFLHLLSIHQLTVVKALASLESSVDIASKLFQNPRVEEKVEYLEVLLAQRDLRDARMVLIDTKREQLSAIVNTYQALGGGLFLSNSVPP
jgi:outer membrane protein TolC